MMVDNEKRPATEPQGDIIMGNGLVPMPQDKDSENSCDEQVEIALRRIKREKAEDENLAKRLSECEVRISDEIPEEVPLLKLGGRTILNRGNIACVTGRYKSMKTFLVTGIAASVDQEHLGFETTDEVRHAVLVDTEQGKSHVYKLLKRIHRLNGWSMEKARDDIRVFSGRELAPEERLSLVTMAALLNQADIVIIDGVRDLLHNFNDIEESSSLVNWLMKRSSQMKCGILCVIHMNKTDNNVRGHLGTELMNKCETVLAIETSKGIATVKPIACRNIEPEEFSFRINDRGLPELCNAPSITEKIKEHDKIFKTIFGDLTRLDRKAVIRRLAETTGKSTRTCERLIKSALEEELLTTTPEGYLCYQPQHSDESLPF